MRKIVVILVVVVLLAGCDAVRLAPSQAQKLNAWLHNRTAVLTADTVKAQDGSQQLQKLADLSALQSRSFAAYFGLPKEYPEVQNVGQVLADSSFELADVALAQSGERPDAWKIADGAIDLGIGIAGLLGGVWGLRAVGFLKQARSKSKALREIVEGNEIFKRHHPDFALSFKAAHKNQSPQTKQIVAEMKG